MKNLQDLVVALQVAVGVLCISCVGSLGGQDGTARAALLQRGDVDEVDLGVLDTEGSTVVLDEF